MKKIIIFGVGDLSNQLFRYIEQDHIYDVIAFSVEEEYIKSDLFCNRPVVAFEKIEDIYSPKEYGMLICIGYNSMNKTRARIFEKVKEKGYEILSYIHPTATVLSNDFGYGNIVLENTSISIGCKIGNGNLIYNCVVLCHDVKIGNFNSISASANFLGHSSMGDYCFVGANSTVKDSTEISDMTLLGANVFINKKTKPKGVYVVNKAQRININSDEIII